MESSHDQGHAPPVRTRAVAWGEPADRRTLQQIAEDVALRARFKVCAIEVLRTDDMLEFVAITGSEEGAARLMGQGSPLTAMFPAFGVGADIGAFTFVAAEWMTPEALNLLEQYGHIPDVSVDEDPGAWLPQDMLVARLHDDLGGLRAVLYLDEPLSGRRPQPAELLTLSDELQLAFRAIVTTVEREEYAQQVRLAQAAREVIRSASSQLGLADLLEVAREHLPGGFRAVAVQVHVHGEEVGDQPHLAHRITEELYRELEKSLLRAWEGQYVLIIEPDHVWGDDVLDGRFREELTRKLTEHRIGTLVLVPMGTAGQLLGAIVIARGLDGLRWTDSESSAALDVGQDLARAVLDNRAFHREQQLNEELRRLDDYRIELISTMSHELKNPIGAILGHIEMMESLPDLPRLAHGSLGAMARAGARLEGLASNLLVLSKLGNTDHPLTLEPVDLQALIPEVVDSLTVLADQQGVRVELAPAEGGAVVEGDREELERVVVNLLSNAVKYSDPGGSVRLAVRELDGEVELSCTDDGLGISEEDQEKLFTEFFRSTNLDAVSRPGSGLGLPIVQRIVVRHGGRIEVDSVLGKGTTFRVMLPARRA